MANLKILIDSVDSVSAVQDLIDRQKPASNCDMVNFISEYLQILHRGQKVGSVIRFASCGLQASATATLASVVADDTITIGAKVLTAKASPANENQFTVGIDDTATAANLVTVINANTGLKNWIKASSVLGVVTLTFLSEGVVGNNIPLAASATITLSDVFLAGGTDLNNKTETM